MKKQLLLSAIIICTGALSAQDVSKVFSSQTLVWFGIDFTKVKMIGMADESPHTVRDEYFKAWNDITIDMDMAKMFAKNAVYKDPNGVSKANRARETESLKATEDADFTAATIADMVNVVPTGQKKVGVGLIMAVQSFNKTTGLATVYVTFFDIANHEVLLSKKLTGKVGGGAWKGAWTSALKDIFSQIGKTEFKAWKKEANF